MGVPVEFRRAEIADIPAISEIRLAVTENVLSNPSSITPKMCEDYLDALGRGWVGVSGQLIVGFSFAALEDQSIWALFVRPGFEGRGVGKALLGLATDWLFENGAERIILSTAVETRADGFYLAQGWTRGEMKNDLEVQFSLWKTDVD